MPVESVESLEIFRSMQRSFGFCTAHGKIDYVNKKTEAFLGVYKKTCFEVYSNESGEYKLMYTFEKRAINNACLRSFIPFHKLYTRELYMYNKVIPCLLDFQKASHPLFTNFAKFLDGSDLDGNEYLIMEDMTEPPHSFTHINSQRVLDYNHMMFAAQQYGKFHALSFVFKHRKPELFAAIVNQLEEDYYHNINQEYLYKFGFLHICQLIEQYLFYDHAALKEFKALKENFLGAVLKVTSSSFSKYNVICHGDANLSNLLFKYGDLKTISIQTKKQTTRPQSPSATASLKLDSEPLALSSAHQLIPPIYQFTGADFPNGQTNAKIKQFFIEEPLSDDDDDEMPALSPLPRPRIINHNRVPIEMCMLDLHMAHYGSPALDLVTLLFTSTDDDFRKHHLWNFLSTYHASLRDSLTLFNMKVNDVYSFATLRSQVQQVAILGVFKAILTLYFKTSEPSDVPDFTQVKDIDDLIYMYSYKNTNIEMFKLRIYAIMKEFLTAGYISHKN